MSHTPGPWTVGETIEVSIGTNQISALSIGNFEYCAGGGVALIHVKQPDFTKANACLIAAAPDLLAALQAIRPYLNAGEALIADAAIAKATGAAA